jgi:hypothetical protein
MTFGAFRLNTLSAALASATNSITATGGTISYYSSGSTTYKVHTITTTGSNSFIVSATTGTPTADILLVGGGGAGGGVSTTIGAGGGGGGGAVVSQTGIAVTAQTYTISVGTGGTGVSGAPGNAGTASTGLTYTANGGGAGTLNSAATNGGGSGTNSTTSFTSTAGTYAFKGGDSFGNIKTSDERAGGGGAGAGAAGTDAASLTGGNGGLPIQNNIDGNNLYYAGGGGGSGTTAGQAYTTAGSLSTTTTLGAGRTTSGAGNSNTTGPYGGGGGGARNTSTTTAAGGNGRQGIAIIRYTVPYVTSVAYVTNVSSTTSSLTFPTIQAGDIAIYGITAANTTTAIPASVTPTGFTLLSSATVGTTLGTRTEIFYKICDGTESASSLTNATGTGSQLTNMVIYRPSSTVNSLVFSTPSNQVTDAAPTNQTLNMTGLTGPYIGLAWGRQSGSSGGITSTGATRTRSYLAGSSGGWNTFEATSSSVSFSTATLSMTDLGTNSLASFTMSIY